MKLTKTNNTYIKSRIACGCWKKEKDSQRKPGEISVRSVYYLILLY